MDVLLSEKARKFTEEGVGKLIWFSGIAACFRSFNNYKGLFPILTYHRVTDSMESGSCYEIGSTIVKVKDFKQQIDFLARRFNFVKHEELRYCLESGDIQALPPKVILITFDDGYADNFLYAYPILRKYDISPIIFLSTNILKEETTISSVLWTDVLFGILDSLETDRLSLINTVYPGIIKGSYNGKREILKRLVGFLKDLKEKDMEGFLFNMIETFNIRIDWNNLKKLYITRAQIKEMSENGVIFGSHGEHHMDFSNIPREDILDNIQKSKNTIEEITGKKCTAFAFPFGEYNGTKEVFDLLLSIGIKFSFILKNRLNRRHYSNNPLYRILPPCSSLAHLYFKLTVLPHVEDAITSLLGRN